MILNSKYATHSMKILYSIKTFGKICKISKNKNLKKTSLKTLLEVETFEN